QCETSIPFGASAAPAVPEKTRAASSNAAMRAPGIRLTLAMGGEDAVRPDTRERAGLARSLRTCPWTDPRRLRWRIGTIAGHSEQTATLEGGFGSMETLDAQPKEAEALRAFQVRHAVHAGLIKCTQEPPLRDVARLMAVHRVHAIVTVGAEDELWGVVSDRDLVSVLASGEGIVAGDASATDVLPVAPDDTL